MAFKESSILFFDGLQPLELGVVPAHLVVDVVLDHVVGEERLHQVDLVVVKPVELRALLGVEVVVRLVLEAVLDGVLLDLLDPQVLQLHQDAVFEVVSHAVLDVEGLLEVLDVWEPVVSANEGGNDVVQGGLNLLLEVLSLLHSCHLSFANINYY